MTRTFIAKTIRLRGDFSCHWQSSQGVVDGDAPELADGIVWTGELYRSAFVWE